MYRRTVVRTAVACGLVVLAALPAGPGAAAGPVGRAVSPSVVLFYSFDNDRNNIVTDKSASHLNGMLTNATSATAYVTGLPGYGKALKLDASQHQFVAVPEGNPLDVNTYTLTALVNYTGVQTAETLDRWEVLEKAGAYWLNIRTDGHLRAGGFYGRCADNRFWKFTDSAAVVPANTWTLVAATYNGSRLKLYVGGVASGSLAVSGATCANNEPLAVGAKNAPAKGILEAFMDGQLDNVRIYNKALTAKQIAALSP